jgi:hypothetical protein
MTKIFENYSAFLAREDKDENGVDQEFAGAREKWENENETNKGCWNCSYCYGCSDCSGCSYCYDCSGCSYCYGCYGCYGCSGCSYCYGCSGCSDCSDCSDCFYQRNLEGEKGAKGTGETLEQIGFPNVPIIDNIHQRIFAAASQSKALNMSSWHTCDTTHCRAGWVEFLAGQEGKALAEKTSTLFAAMQIYKKSSPDIRVFPPRFFEDNETALSDMEKCAKLEADQTLPL